MLDSLINVGTGGGGSGGGSGDADIAFTDMGEPNGFVDTDNTLSFDDGTRTLTITPSGATFSYYSSGTKQTKTGAQNIVISNDEGLHYIYYLDGTLTDTTTFNDSLITTYAFVAVVYWDVSAGGSNILLGNEQHGCTMDARTHQYLHNTQGAKISSGGALGDISVGSSAQFSVEATTFWDEDIKFTHTAQATSDDVYIYNRVDGDPNNRWEVTVNTGGDAGVPYLSATYPYWNELTGGSWQQTEASNNNYVLAHCVALNDTTRKFGIIMGQAEYTTVKNAQDGALTEVNSLVTAGLPSPEFVFLGTMIISTADGNLVATADGDDYVDLRDFSFFRGNVAVTVTNHNDTANIQGGNGSDEFYHLNAADYGKTFAEAITITSQAEYDALSTPITNKILYITSAISIDEQMINCKIYQTGGTITFATGADLDGCVVHAAGAASMTGTASIISSDLNFGGIFYANGSGSTTFNYNNLQCYRLYFGNASWWNINGCKIHAEVEIAFQTSVAALITFTYCQVDTPQVRHERASTAINNVKIIDTVFNCFDFQTTATTASWIWVTTGGYLNIGQIEDADTGSLSDLIRTDTAGTVTVGRFGVTTSIVDGIEHKAGSSRVVHFEGAAIPQGTTDDSALSAPAAAFTGDWITGGDATTTKPHHLIEPSGTTSTGWSTSGTGLGINAASGFAGNLLDLQVGGAQQAVIDSAGNGLFGFSSENSVRIGYNTSPAGGAARMGLYATGGGKLWLTGYGNNYFGYDGKIGISGTAFGFSGTEQGTLDVLLRRDAADILAQRRSTNAQTYRLYNTYTDASNYERGILAWDTNVFKISTENAGTGSARTLQLSGGGSGTTLQFESTGPKFSDWVNLNNVFRAGGSLYTVVRSDGGYSWSSDATVTGSADLYLLRDAANTLALRNSTNAQAFSIYNTYTSSTNYERGNIKWDTNELVIGTEKGSGGGTARAMAIQTDGTDAINIDTSQNVTVAGNFLVGTIKSGATQGAAGAAANELWKTASHATLPDNVVMIGV